MHQEQERRPQLEQHSPMDVLLQKLQEPEAIDLIHTHLDARLELQEKCQPVTEPIKQNLSKKSYKEVWYNNLFVSSTKAKTYFIDKVVDGIRFYGDDVRSSADMNMFACMVLQHPQLREVLGLRDEDIADLDDKGIEDKLDQIRPLVQKLSQIAAPAILKRLNIPISEDATPEVIEDIFNEQYIDRPDMPSDIYGAIVGEVIVGVLPRNIDEQTQQQLEEAKATSERENQTAISLAHENTGLQQELATARQQAKDFERLLQESQTSHDRTLKKMEEIIDEKAKLQAQLAQIQAQVGKVVLAQAFNTAKAAVLQREVEEKGTIDGELVHSKAAYDASEVVTAEQASTSTAEDDADKPVDYEVDLKKAEKELEEMRTEYYDALEAEELDSDAVERRFRTYNTSQFEAWKVWRDEHFDELIKPIFRDTSDQEESAYEQIYARLGALIEGEKSDNFLSDAREFLVGLEALKHLYAETDDSKIDAIEQLYENSIALIEDCTDGTVAYTGNLKSEMLSEARVKFGSLHIKNEDDFEGDDQDDLYIEHVDVPGIYPSEEVKKKPKVAEAFNTQTAEVTVAKMYYLMPNTDGYELDPVPEEHYELETNGKQYKLTQEGQEAITDTAEAVDKHIDTEAEQLAKQVIAKKIYGIIPEGTRMGDFVAAASTEAKPRYLGDVIKIQETDTLLYKIYGHIAKHPEQFVDIIQSSVETISPSSDDKEVMILTLHCLQQHKIPDGNTTYSPVYLQVALKSEDVKKFNDLLRSDPKNFGEFFRAVFPLEKKEDDTPFIDTAGPEYHLIKGNASNMHLRDAMEPQPDNEKIKDLLKKPTTPQ